MKPNIHPDNYRTVLFFDSSANEGWLIRSCAETATKPQTVQIVRQGEATPYWFKVNPL